MTPPDKFGAPSPRHDATNRAYCERCKMEHPVTVKCLKCGEPRPWRCSGQPVTACAKCGKVPAAIYPAEKAVHDALHPAVPPASEPPAPEGEAVAYRLEDAVGKVLDYFDTEPEAQNALFKAEDDKSPTMTTDKGGRFVPWLTKPFRVVPLYLAPPAAATVEEVAECLTMALGWLDDPSAYYGNGNNEWFPAKVRAVLSLLRAAPPARSAADEGAVEALRAVERHAAGYDMDGGFRTTKYRSMQEVDSACARNWQAVLDKARAALKALDAKGGHHAS